MHIIYLRDLGTRNIEAPLLRLALSEDPLQRCKGQKLLELVRYLQAQGVVPQVFGEVIFGELWLISADPASRVLVKVWADWRDHAPLRDGVPEMHYRLQIERPGAKLSTDARARSSEEAERVIWEAFGWSR